MVSYCNPAVMFGMDRTHAAQAQNYYPPYHHYPTAHHHPHHHQTGSGTQNVPSEFNCNYPYQHHMSPETMAAAAAGWAQPSMYSACASTRNIVPNGHEDWTHHSYPHPHHPSFYSHQHPSPPNSTPSPSTTGTHSPNVSYPGTGFKTDFGPCSGGNSQENNSQEIQSHNVASSGGSTLVPVGTPHSSDSGLPSSDVSAGSPNGHHHQVSSNLGSHHSNVHNHSGVSDMKINCNSLRPTQARSPYEWMKKTSYNSISNSTGLSGGKTRTKDKYRVVYSDTQRVELEKEFHFSKYITIRRKSELASILGLSERQVKIWFQNRRAKARKTQRKQEEQFQREKVATMIHMQNAAVLSGNMTSLNGPIVGICNQSSEDLQYR